MNNLPLQPLVWARIDTQKLSGIYCEKTDSYIEGAVSFCSTPVAEYVIRKDKETGKYSANYGGRHENTYDTINEAEHWAEHTHYPSQMQPYVKPSPTWIDVDDRLPEEDGLYLALRKGFTFEMGNASDLVPQVSGWNGGRGCFDDDHGNVLITHWMPIPEFSTMQNLHKGE